MLVIHFDPCVTPDGVDDSAAYVDATWGHRDQLVDLYSRWAGYETESVCVLAPEHERPHGGARMAGLRTVVPLWYSHEGIPALPAADVRSQIWVVNGQQLPMIDWSAARAAVRRHSSDIIVFGSSCPQSKPHYPESVLVGKTGEVVKLTRHYSDSPAFTDLWCGEASFLVASGRHASAVLNHIAARGWGLDSIGALTRRFSVRWSSTPCVLSGFALPPATHPQRAASHDGTEPERQTDPPQIVDNADADDKPAGGLIYLLTKRLFDIIASGLGLLILSPILLAIAVLIKATSHGPVLFGHKRQGMAGREFRCWKFRSMLVGAEAMQAELRHKNEVDGPQFKITDDPRITRVGAWLRRSNLDELPQLFNVLVGDMSLVGPRPSPDAENQLCPAWRRTRLSVKPGITGLWQVLRMRSPHASDFQEWIYYDVEYNRHRTLLLDLQLVLYTVLAIFMPQCVDGLARRLHRRGVCRYSSRLMDADASSADTSC